MTEDTDQASAGSLEDLGRLVVSQIRQGLALSGHQPLAETKADYQSTRHMKVFFMDEAHLLSWPKGDPTKDSRS
ncbi:hypothetical protein RYA05_03245 [Pseudomonas syringae pv. actinidiae]|nr:hypothetical protein [Pseudomonas syringae pv. actinidiae]